MICEVCDRAAYAVLYDDHIRCSGCDGPTFVCDCDPLWTPPP